VQKNSEKQEPTCQGFFPLDAMLTVASEEEQTDEQEQGRMQDFSQGGKYRIVIAYRV
jgi:hypothetical protein